MRRVIVLLLGSLISCDWYTIEPTGSTIAAVPVPNTSINYKYK